MFQFLEQLLPCLKQVISVHILDEYVMNVNYLLLIFLPLFLIN